jgi:hypothetical protein
MSALRKFVVLLVCITALAGAQAVFAQAGGSGQGELGVPVDAGIGPMATPRAPPDGRFHVYLNDDSHLVGKLEIGAKITLESLVGPVELPAAEIDALEFSQRPKAVVRFRNGDQLTGELPIMSVKLKTAWGEPEIELRHIVSIVSHEEYMERSAVPRPGMSPATWVPSPAGYAAPTTPYYDPMPIEPAPRLVPTPTDPAPSYRSP